MNKSIKILHYGLSSNRGGIENVVLSWLEHKPKDIHFDFVYEGNEPLDYQDVIDSYKDINIYRIPNRFKQPLRHYNALKKLINENKYDYVHCHIMTMAEPFIAALINNHKRYKVIFHCHSMYKGIVFSFKERILQFITSLLLINKKYIKLACGKEAGEFMFKDNFEVIENGIDIDNFKFSSNNRKTIREKLGISNNDILIGHVGHSCIEKNYPFLFSSFSLLKDKKYKLLLIGNMVDDEEIKNLIKKNNIEDRVVFTGLINNVNDYYSAMDLFYLPSLNEGFPVTLVEAQANGLPCIASKNITKDCKITDNLVFIDFDNNEFKKSIELLINKKSNRNNVAFDMKYSTNNSSNKMFDVYRNNLIN